MKKTLLTLCLFVFSFAAFTQTKLLAIEDAMVNNRGSLAVKNLRQAQFVNGTDDVVYLSDNSVWMKAANGSIASFLTLDDLNKKLKAAGLKEVTAMPAIHFKSPAGWLMTVDGNKISLDPLTNKAKIIIDKTTAGKEQVEESCRLCSLC